VEVGGHGIPHMHPSVRPYSSHELDEGKYASLQATHLRADGLVDVVVPAVCCMLRDVPRQGQGQGQALEFVQELPVAVLVVWSRTSFLLRLRQIQGRRGPMMFYLMIAPRFLPVVQLPVVELLR